MGKKRQNLLEDPPTATSSDEIETLSGDEEKEEEVEEQISSDESSSDGERYELTKPLEFPSDMTTKSPSSSAVNKCSSSRSEKPKENHSSPAAKSGKKRKRETTPKKKKNVSGVKKAMESDSKKPTLNRLWSEEDEITLLQGMIDFKANKGNSPYDNMTAFYESVKNSICFAASRNQAVDKIRSLKKKYFVKKKKDVESYLTDHDKDCLRLANFIWGSDGLALESVVNQKRKSERKLDEVNGEKEGEEGEEEGDREVFVNEEVFVNGENEEEEEEEEDGDREVFGNDQVLVNGGGKRVEENGKKVVVEEEEEELELQGDLFEESFVVGSVVGFGVNEQFLKRKWRTTPMETRKRIEEKLKLLHAKEIEVFAKKTDIMGEISAMLAK